jgi:hypothetical protein
MNAWEGIQSTQLNQTLMKSGVAPIFLQLVDGSSTPTSKTSWAKTIETASAEVLSKDSD